jgi:hypothetical protein
MCIRGLVYRDEFAHRLNENDTVDSICLYCFATVGSAPKEADLEGAETAHPCSHRMVNMNGIRFRQEVTTAAMLP